MRQLKSHTYTDRVRLDGAGVRTAWPVGDLLQIIDRDEREARRSSSPRTHRGGGRGGVGPTLGCKVIAVVSRTILVTISVYAASIARPCREPSYIVTVSDEDTVGGAFH